MLETKNSKYQVGITTTPAGRTKFKIFVMSSIWRAVQGYTHKVNLTAPSKADV